MNEYTILKKCVEIIKSRTDLVPDIALTLGSGLGYFSENVKVLCEISYSEFPDFPKSTVSGHAGKFVFGYLGSVPVALMNGRVHYYEGYDSVEAVRPVRTLALLGAKKFVLTNAAGGVNLTFKPGTLMLIKDHISSFVPSPLRGRNIDELGVRFPDMSSVYDPDLSTCVTSAAEELGIPLREGVYLQFPGPQYETPAEISMASALGADAVGMSTAIEATSLNHMGVKVCGISCITNLAAGIAKHKLTHEEVKETSERVSEQFSKLLLESVKRMQD